LRVGGVGGRADAVCSQARDPGTDRKERSDSDVPTTSHRDDCCDRHGGDWCRMGDDPVQRRHHQRLLQESDGQVRIIDPAADKCQPSETPISWSQAGPPGAPGIPGGLSGYSVVRVSGAWPQGDQHVVTAVCPEGTSVLGGGWFPVDYQGTLVVVGSYPEGRSGWSLYAFNGSSDFGPATAWVYATCATTA
jgi:hypothetical protein